MLVLGFDLIFEDYVGAWINALGAGEVFTKFGNGFGFPCGKYQVLPDGQDAGCGWIDFASVVQDFADQGVGFAVGVFGAGVQTWVLAGFGTMRSGASSEHP